MKDIQKPKQISEAELADLRERLSHQHALSVTEYMQCLQYGIPFAPDAVGVIPMYGEMPISEILKKTSTPQVPPPGTT